MGKLKNKSGITLIALVITILVLLILAGVAIYLAIGENGLFNQTKIAVEKYKEAQNKEEEELQLVYNEIEGLNNKGNIITDIASNRENTPANSENTMSGEEHFLGEYYFNGKPIYAKTLYVESLPNSTEKYYIHGISDVDMIWVDYTKCFGIFPDFNVSLPLVATGNYPIGIGSVNETTFSIVTYKDRSNICAYVTLNYTKTTDHATVESQIPKAILSK